MKCYSHTGIIANQFMNDKDSVKHGLLLLQVVKFWNYSTA